MNILILGSEGMLGSALMSVFPDATGFDKLDLDITNEQAVHEAVRGYDFVINAAGYTDVDGAESESMMANKINGGACGYLADACRNLVHFSTDYVFDGSAKEGYKEDDEPRPLNAYGNSKLIGENLIRKKLPKHFIIRTSWLFGPNGKNFVRTVLKLANERKHLKVVNDQIGCPTFTYDLSEATRKLIMGGFDYGTYHIVNSGPTTWYRFAKEILTQANINIDVQPISTEDFPTPAIRPKCSILLSEKFPPLRSHREALAEYLKDQL